MKKKFRVEVDCANCAAKMEDAIRKVEGVQEVSVNFMTQKMTIEADDESFDEIMKNAAKAAKKADDDCVIYLD